jgi:tetratricopeptide (TPR) repeat protein
VRGAAAALLLLVASVGVHWPPADAGFAYDDVDFVVSNASLRSPEAALAALLAPFPPQQPERALYRPLTHLSYAFDHALFGDRARCYHATNTLLYGAVVLLVHRLALAWGLAPGAAFAAALLFAAHPVHSEPVDAVAGRSELLSLLLSLCALLLFRRATRAGSGGALALWAAAVAQLLACLAKESAAVLPGILAADLLASGALARGAPARGRALARLVPSLCAVVAWLLLRTLVLDRFSPLGTPLAGRPLGTRLLTMGSVLFVYLRLLVFPDRLQPDFYYQVLVGIPERATPAALLGWALAAALLAAALRLVLRALRRGEALAPREAAALRAFAVFFGFLLPVSHVVDIGVLVGERLLLAPSLGFVLLAVIAGQRALEGIRQPSLRRAVAVGLVAALAVAGALRSRARADEWRDPVRLWLSASRALPDDPRVASNLATAYYDRGDLASAEAALSRALALDPGLQAARGNLGLVRLAQGRLDEAEAIFAALVAADPRDARSWTHLAQVELARGRPEAARAHLERALAIDDNFAPARVLRDGLR